jgi:hypothetical protein
MLRTGKVQDRKSLKSNSQLDSLLKRQKIVDAVNAALALGSVLVVYYEVRPI